MATAHPSTRESSAQRGATLSGWSIGQADAEGLDELLSRIEAGFAAEAVEQLRTRLDLSVAEMARLLDMSARTLGRRQEEGHLTAAESDRLYRYARLFERAVAVLGNEEKACTWLKKEQWALGDRVPLETVRYEPGAREVEDLLGRIEHGLPV